MTPNYEHIQTSERISINVQRRVAACFPFHWHHHAEFELTLITEADGSLFVADMIHPFAKNHLALFSPFLPHAYLSVRSEPSEGEHEKKHEAVVAHFLASHVTPWPESMHIEKLLKRAQSGLLFSGEGIDDVIEKFKTLPDEDNHARVLKLLSILHQLGSDSRIMIKPLSTSKQYTRKSVDARINHTLTYLTENFAEQITQAEVAEQLGMTPPSFARLMQRSLGRRFTHILHDIRINHASQLLRETDKPITVIALESGFNNLSNFNRIFLRLKMMPPMSYRLQHQQHLRYTK
ncbi:helix-turn-helix domain-containing protein [Planctomycetota bacterium]|nr:helix-turn-helix domain-containing protein [Planctomycetota bacterium]